jgi:hypothetical protein
VERKKVIHKELKNKIKFANMINQYDIDKETLLKLKENLPFGGLKLLAERAGYSTNFLHKFFKGNATINDSNKVILTEASKIIREYQDKSEALKKEILACLERNSKPTQYNIGVEKTK